jgi:uncharacterized protein YqjF (DUF2071 family)
MIGVVSRSPTARRAFLTAEWRYLAMLNYVVDPALLEPDVPAGTELDYWHGKALVSVVGFRFLRTRVLGAPIPFHRDFDEVNLRFYVRRVESGEVRRGVVFLRELVPRVAIATVARLAYNEPYRSVPMTSDVRPGDDRPQVHYAWRIGGWHGIRAEADGDPQVPRDGSEEQFITEHYWGYTRQRDGSTVEYEVVHPSWRVWPALGTLDADPEALRLVPSLGAPPDSVLIAEGSPVSVYRPRTIAARSRQG